MNEVRAAQEELSSAYQEAGRSFYASSQGSPGPEAAAAEGGAEATGEGGGADEVEEADYEIVDEPKK
jgi:molecular chaperone DnaK